MSVDIRRHTDREPPPIGPLVTAATVEDIGFVARALDEWVRGTNRFDRPGECFFVAWSGGDLVGMCGVNRDPFTARESGVGRLRHLYVLPRLRREGIGSRLVAACLESGRGSFTRIRLRTPGMEGSTAGLFYRSIGFLPVDEPHATHSWAPTPTAP